MIETVYPSITTGFIPVVNGIKWLLCQASLHVYAGQALIYRRLLGVTLDSASAVLPHGYVCAGMFRHIHLLTKKRNGALPACGCREDTVFIVAVSPRGVVLYALWWIVGN